nr:acetyltransferase [Prevotella sp.]
MEVRDIFALRKEGRTEEAYNAIIPMYKVHQGHFTTLAMFWVGSDMLSLILSKGMINDAMKIFHSLCNVYQHIDDKDGKGQSVILHSAIKICDADSNFSMTDFILNWGIEKLGTADWTASQYNNHIIPSIAQRIIARIYSEVENNPTPENANRVIPIINEALKHNRSNMTFLRLMALLYKISGAPSKAEVIYALLLEKHRLSYLYTELAEVCSNPKEQIILYCAAICSQRNEQFRTKSRIHLAHLLYSCDSKERAAFEIQQSITNREQGGFHLSKEQLDLAKDLKVVTPVIATDEFKFYQEEMLALPQLLREKAKNR